MHFKNFSDKIYGELGCNYILFSQKKINDDWLERPKI